MAEYFNYELIYCDNNGVNSFLIRKDKINTKVRELFPNIGDINDIYKKPRYGSGPNGGHNNDYKNRIYIKYNPWIIDNVELINFYNT